MFSISPLVNLYSVASSNQADEAVISVVCDSDCTGGALAACLHAMMPAFECDVVTKESNCKFCDSVILWCLGT